MHLNITAGGTNYNIEVARSHSDIVCAQAVITPAEVNVSGRVTAGDSKALAGALVSLTDQQGNTLSATSNLTGNYTITGVTAGRSYVFTAQRSGYTFPTTVVTVRDEITGLDIVGQR